MHLRIKDNKNLPAYSLIRSKRRTITLIISEDAQLKVRAPLRASQESIESFIFQKQNWIHKTKNRFQIANQRTFREYKNGEKFLFLGKYYELTLQKKAPKKFYFENAFFLDEDKKDSARDFFTAWYKQQARTIITERVHFWANQFKLKFKSIKINSAKKRWGSCTRAGSLNFTWRLVLAPLPVVDYVVVHELAHLKHLNHSASFWNFVGTMYPDYKKHKKWLFDYGDFLKL